MKKLVIGILAHVDAGKTTLSEGILYRSGMLRKIGRVDNGDAFLNTYALEKERGITIFSKQANFRWKNMEVSLLDTPGHVDFSAEMERTLPCNQRGRRRSGAYTDSVAAFEEIPDSGFSFYQ